MGIALPEPQIDPAGAVLREHFTGVSFSWSDVSDEDPNEAAVIDQFGEFGCEQILSVVSVVSHVLARGLSADEEAGAQNALATWLLPGAIAQIARDRLTATGSFRRHVIFFQEQLLAASSLALLHGSDGPPRDVLTTERRHALGTLLLKISSLLSIGRALAPESDEVLGSTVRLLHIGSNEYPSLPAARYFDLFHQRARAAFETNQLSHDMNADFRAAYGVDLAGAMAIGPLAALPWINLEQLADIDGGYWTAGRAVADLFTRLGIISAAEELFIADRAWFRGRLRVSPLTAANYLPLYERPFLRTGDRGILPINWRLAMDRTFGGLYWAIHGMYLKDGGPEAVQRWMGELGKTVFEPYVEERFRAMYPNPRNSTSRYWSEAEIGQYRSASGQVVDGADGYVHEGRNLMVMDVTASSIPASTMVSGDGGRFRTDVQRLLIDGKLGQLDRVIRDIQAGRLTLPDLSLAEVDVIIPVVLTAAPFPQFPTVWAAVRELWEKAGLFGAGSRVMPPQMMSFEELELLEDAVSKGEVELGRLLEGRQRDFTGSGLKNYCIRVNAALLRPSQRCHTLYRQYAEVISDYLRTAGVSET
jgi:hypothetical protein